jgi:hypothetical protein
MVEVITPIFVVPDAAIPSTVDWSWLEEIYPKEARPVTVELIYTVFVPVEI